MKLSTTMLVVAFALFFGVLLVYNFSLKAAYLKGTFRERFGEHTFSKLNNVRQLRLNANNLMSISIEHGAQEGIWISKYLKGRVKVSQLGEIVTVDLLDTDPKNYMHIGTGDVVIMVNKLKDVKTYNHQVKGQRLENYGTQVNVVGLREDSFSIIIAEQGTAYIENSKFKSFKAVVGGDKYWSRLTIASNNQLDTAYFDVRKSSLELQNPVIGMPHYKLGDSSRIELWGKSAKQFAR